MKQELVYPELSYKICRFLFDAHNELGRYCNEKQYGDYLEQEFKKRNISYKKELILPPSFEGESQRNRVDFLIDDKIIIELKC
jgi:GxxExxY protein